MKIGKSYDFKLNLYKARIRIRPEQLDWLKRHKPHDKTIAGFLEEIINAYKGTKGK